MGLYLTDEILWDSSVVTCTSMDDLHFFFVTRGPKGPKQRI